MRTKKLALGIFQQLRINKHFIVSLNIAVEDAKFSHLDCTNAEKLIEIHYSLRILLRLCNLRTYDSFVKPLCGFAKRQP